MFHFHVIRWDSEGWLVHKIYYDCKRTADEFQLNFEYVNVYALIASQTVKFTCVPLVGAWTMGIYGNKLLRFVLKWTSYRFKV